MSPELGLSQMENSPEYERAGRFLRPWLEFLRRFKEKSEEDYWAKALIFRNTDLAESLKSDWSAVRINFIAGRAKPFLELTESLSFETISFSESSGLESRAGYTSFPSNCVIPFGNFALRLGRQSEPATVLTTTVEKRISPPDAETLISERYIIRIDPRSQKIGFAAQALPENTHISIPGIVKDFGPDELAKMMAD